MMSSREIYYQQMLLEPDLTITRVALAGNYGRRAHSMPFTEEEIARFIQQDKEDQERWEQEGGKHE